MSPVGKKNVVFLPTGADLNSIFNTFELVLSAKILIHQILLIMTKIFFFLIAILAIQLLGNSCRKFSEVSPADNLSKTATNIVDRSTPPLTQDQVSQGILNGTLPPSIVYQYGRVPSNIILPWSSDGGGEESVCDATIIVRSLNGVPIAPNAWGIAVVELDANLNPITEYLFGGCPNCLPLQNYQFSWSLNAQETHWDIFFIYFNAGGVSTVSVKEIFPIGSSDPGGNDVYGHWFVDLHQFNTVLICP